MSEPLLTNRMKKEFASLDDAKGRRRSGLFVAEGTKCVLELMAAFAPRHIFALPEWVLEHGHGLPVEPTECGRGVLGELSRLSTTPPVVAFFALPEPPEMPEASYFASRLTVALDCVQDPGNLGTIIRTCNWFGVDTILASRDTVDAFNPKTVQATMGALTRTRVIYTDLPEALASMPPEVGIYGTFLDGDNIYTQPLATPAVMIMGNEGRGISEAVERAVGRRLYIPSSDSADGVQAVESLNVATATAISLSEFAARRYRSGILCKK